MIVLVYDNQIVGTSNSFDNLPSGFTAFETASAALDDLYFDGEAVKIKPERTDPLAYWQVDHWEVPVIPAPEPAYEPFSSSPLFQEAWEKAQTDIKTLAIFATALYADSKGDQALLEHTQNILLALLTEPGASPNAPVN